MRNRNIVTMLGTGLAVLTCFALSPGARAVVPAPDGCYPGFTTAEGCNALAGLTTGAGNTGVGWFALFSAGASNFNTGIGGGALVLNTGDSNTAVGAAALLLNTTGENNTAVGTDALVFNAVGFNNTAVGFFALENNTSSGNTGLGSGALTTNTTGTFNTAVGGGALVSNDDGNGNTTVGVLSLSANLHGDLNTAIGFAALQNTVNSDNTAVGAGALSLNTIGAGNTALSHSALHDDVIGGSNTVGPNAGSAVVNSHDVICIGSPGAEVNDSCFIGNIRGVTTDLNDAVAVLIDSAGQLGTMSSSQRFKKDIKPMETTSDSILSLKPVTFHYKSDKSNTPQFGLIAEEVAKVNPSLVVHDKDGQIYTVRYEAVNAMLLNEFLKEHKKVQDLEGTVAQQQKGMEVLTAQVREQAAQIQKVSAQVEMAKPATKVAVGSQ